MGDWGGLELERRVWEEVENIEWVKRWDGMGMDGNVQNMADGFSEA